MALIWEKKTSDTHYQVRNAGQAVRLYTDGVFHSQYNPRQPVTGNIWELLMLPALFYQAEEIRRVLVLGVGGGAVIQQLQYFLSPDQITGVELDEVHLYIAKKYFKVKDDNIKLHHDDAVKWINKYKGKPFDMIIDDLCGGESGEPVRAVTADSPWVKKLMQHLSPHGVLVSNFITRKELNQSAYLRDKTIRKSFASSFLLTNPGYENSIVAFLRQHASTAQLREKLVTIPELNPRLKTSRLKYHIRQI